MITLYNFYCDCGRMGFLEGVFVADDTEVNNIIGKEIYFGEVLGKHSDISVIMLEDHFTKLTDDQEFIDKFKEYRCASGYNPLAFYDAEA